MNGRDNEQNHRFLTLGIAIGAGFGVALGLILSTVFDNPGFFAIGISCGLGTGLSIGVALDERETRS